MIRFFFIFLLLASSATAQKQDTSINILAQGIVLALKNENYADLKKWIVTPELFFKEIVPMMKKDDSIHHRRVSFDYDGPDHFYQRNLIDSLNRLVFSATLKEGKRLGIQNWNDIRLVRIEKEFVEDPNFEGHIIIEYKSVQYVIYAVSAVRLSMGYRLSFFRGILTDDRPKQ
jgi:hypothetical protein